MKANLLHIVLIMSMLLAAVGPVAAKPPVTTIYLVRHAEKDPTPGLADPPLTPAGEARAQLLARRLVRRHPAALFTTDTRRTRATLTPLAQATNLTPLVYNAQDPNGLAIRLYKEYAGRTVVVAGHSNTMLPLLTALGVTAPMQEIKDEEYDYLFKVELRPGQPARLVVSRYGAAARVAAGGSMR
ncbi:histidine phosphatase family protein [Hymenobacter sp. H14-R3]|uniref:histidine phosphatase family protein n=1 Tax=Hymenobacter sp. H14-R3 TaxID=3046308 RepID=UPI0024BAB88F|nr:histidine phosphatase family protein [Hymenobacter sp. H14-R3]MDJ0366008.1 histidine phosphatase family protein [Hymenobacter sp. H14-R3]